MEWAVKKLGGGVRSRQDFFNTIVMQHQDPDYILFTPRSAWRNETKNYIRHRPRPTGANFRRTKSWPLRIFDLPQIYVQNSGFPAPKFVFLYFWRKFLTIWLKFRERWGIFYACLLPWCHEPTTPLWACPWSLVWVVSMQYMGVSAAWVRADNQ